MRLQLRKMMKWTAGVGGAAAMAAIVVINPVGFFPNTGLPYGYYGYHNIVRVELSRRPETRVVSELAEEDITLEGSFFDVDYRGRRIQLVFVWESFDDSVNPRDLLDDLEAKMDKCLQTASPHPRLVLTSKDGR